LAIRPAWRIQHNISRREGSTRFQPAQEFIDHGDIAHRPEFTIPVNPVGIKAAVEPGPLAFQAVQELVGSMVVTFLLPWP
jgi:hypothetical protein